MPCRLSSCSLLISLSLWPGTSAASLCSASPHAPLAIPQSAVLEPVHVSPEAMQRRLIKKIAPEYPPSALRAQIEGTVILNVEISKSGDVLKTSLFSGHPMLASAAARAVSQWKYNSYLVNGEPVDVQTTARVDFAISGKPPAQGVAGDMPGNPPDWGINSAAPIMGPVIGPNGTPLQSVRLAASLMQSRLIGKVNPEYPPEARKQRVQGEVVIRIIIDKNGDVYKADTISGHPLLTLAAAAAVKQWKYTPYTLNGEPVVVETIVRVNFSLSDDVPPDGAVGAIPGAVPAGSPEMKSGMIDGILSSTPSVKPSVAAPAHIRASAGMMTGLLLTKVDPIYPPDALKTRIQDQVVLRVNIDKEGNVSKIEPVSGHQLLIPAAMEAVRQWKYRPYVLNDHPVEVETEVLINFTLLGN